MTGPHSVSHDESQSEFKQQFRAMAQGVQSLGTAYMGVVNGLFVALGEAGSATAPALAATTQMDAAYVVRWCDAAYAFGYLEADRDTFRLSETGAAMRPDVPGTLMPMAVRGVLSSHMAERAAGLMRSGARPGEQVIAEQETILPWFGPMLEANFADFFERVVCPGVPIFQEVDARGGLVVDLGCGNGWYLRALARRCGAVRGLGFDGFSENVVQAMRRAEAEGLSKRLRFAVRNAHDVMLDESADIIAMNRALHHMWEAGGNAFLRHLCGQLRPGGAAVIWEPDYPTDRGVLRVPARRSLAFQNLSEHIQGNHLLRADEIAAAFAEIDMTPEVFHFADGLEVIIVARRAA